MTVAFAICGSFCNFSTVIPVMEQIKKCGVDILPIMSNNAAVTDTRFGTAEDFKKKIAEITGREILTTIADVEPIGPKKLADVLAIAPCTGNTLGKLANGITDTSVTLAAKSHLRSGRPVVIALSSNDSLSMSAQNLGRLLNTKNIYFVPMRQDDIYKKPRSLSCDFFMLWDCIELSRKGVQMQPIFV